MVLIEDWNELLNEEKSPLCKMCKWLNSCGKRNEAVIHKHLNKCIFRIFFEDD